MKKVILLFLALYAMLTGYTIVSIALGSMPSPLMTPLSTLAGFTFALLHASQREGWKRALLLLATVILVSLLFESVGVATGWVYGPYHYTDKLGPKFLGLVPYLIPIAWFMMSYPSFVIADWLVPSVWGYTPRLLSVAAVGGMAMTAWDVVMDPIMVAGGHWVWDVQGAYHGIPLQNFWGWWLTVFCSYSCYLLLAGRGRTAPRSQMDRLTVASYGITTLGMVIPTLLGGAGDLALIGWFAMTPWVIAGWLKMAVSRHAAHERKEKEHDGPVG